MGRLQADTLDAFARIATGGNVVSKQPNTPRDVLTATAIGAFVFLLMLGGMLWIVSRWMQ